MGLGLELANAGSASALSAEPRLRMARWLACGWGPQIHRAVDVAPARASQLLPWREGPAGTRQSQLRMGFQTGPTGPRAMESPEMKMVLPHGERRREQCSQLLVSQER